MLLSVYTYLNLMSNFIDRLKLIVQTDKEFRTALYDIMGFYPHDVELYRIAFAHKSQEYKSKRSGDRPLNNERLEFLGDAVLETVVSDIVYHRFQNKREGFLTNTRSKIVSRESLGRIAKEIGLERLIQSHTYSRSHNSFIAGNAFEALMGAIYLDRGFEFAFRFIEKRIFGKQLNLESVAQKEVNFKSKLLEYCQKNRLMIDFNDKSEGEKGSNPSFITSIVIEGLFTADGKGYSKKEAHQNAAREALLRMRREPMFEDSIYRAKEGRTAMEADPCFVLPVIDEIEADLAREKEERESAAREQRNAGNKKSDDAQASRKAERKRAEKKTAATENKAVEKAAENAPADEKPVQKASKTEKAAKAEKTAKTEENVGKEKQEKPQKAAKAPKADKPVKVEKAEKQEKPQKKGKQKSAPAAATAEVTAAVAAVEAAAEGGVPQATSVVADTKVEESSVETPNSTPVEPKESPARIAESSADAVETLPESAEVPAEAGENVAEVPDVHPETAVNAENFEAPAAVVSEEVLPEPAEISPASAEVLPEADGGISENIAEVSDAEADVAPENVAETPLEVAVETSSESVESPSETIESPSETIESFSEPADLSSESTVNPSESAKSSDETVENSAPVTAFSSDVIEISLDEIVEPVKENATVLPETAEQPSAPAAISDEIIEISMESVPEKAPARVEKKVETPVPTADVRPEDSAKQKASVRTEADVFARAAAMMATAYGTTAQQTPAENAASAHPANVKSGDTKGNSGFVEDDVLPISMESVETPVRPAKKHAQKSAPRVEEPRVDVMPTEVIFDDFSAPLTDFIPADAANAADIPAEITEEMAAALDVTLLDEAETPEMLAVAAPAEGVEVAQTAEVPAADGGKPRRPRGRRQNATAFTNTEIVLAETSHRAEKAKKKVEEARKLKARRMAHKDLKEATRHIFDENAAESGAESTVETDKPARKTTRKPRQRTAKKRGSEGGGQANNSNPATTE